MGRKRSFNFSKPTNISQLKNVSKNGSISKQCKNMPVKESNKDKCDLQILEKDCCSEIQDTIYKVEKKRARVEGSDSLNERNVNSMTKINVQGHINQGSVIFGLFAGRQCVAISLLSILFSKLYDIRLWTSNTLDRILHIGTELYASIRNSRHAHNDYMLISELPRLLHIDALNSSFNLDISAESQVGLVGVEQYTNADVGMSLYEALQACLSFYDSCFITFGGNTFSVIHIDDKFYVFDSHSRDRNGMMTADGKSVLIEMNDLWHLYNHCMNLSTSMNLPQNSQFEITEVESNPMLFCPLTLKRRNEFSDFIGVPADTCTSNNIAERSILHTPKVIKNIHGDD